MQQVNMMGFQQNGFGNSPAGGTGMNPFSVPFGNHTVQPPNGAWPNGQMVPMGMNGPLPDGTMASTGGQIGPMRRNTGRFNARQAGPYDRRNLGQQNRMYNQPTMNGPLSPVGIRNSMGNGLMMPGGSGGGGGRGGMMMGMGAGARWDSGGGQQAMGPKEAVQGRSLKSYEDLDAVGGSGGGELNY